MAHAVTISSAAFHRLQEHAVASGRSIEVVVEDAITRYLGQQYSQGSGQQQEEPEPGPSSSGAAGRKLDWLRQQSLVPLYIAEPIISLVDGLLEGDHCVSDCLEKGNFGLGTLDFLDGEVLVLDGVAYHQGQAGVKVLEGNERTPFMTVAMFDKSRCKQIELDGVSDFESLQSQIQSHFRSKNVVYAVLIEGTFSYVKCRAVCKQAGHVRLKDVAEQQVVFEHSDECGCLVGFWCPPYVGGSINVPGFHFHFLSDDKQRGGHLLQVAMQQGTAHLQEIHRAQIDLPFRDDFMQSQLLINQASADLEAAEK